MYAGAETLSARNAKNIIVVCDKAMQFETLNVDGPLSQAVETIFLFTDFEADYSIERIVPTGSSFILFELDGVTRHVLDDRTFVEQDSFEGVWISGLRRRFLTVSVPRKSSMLVCQFKSLGAHSCFHFPLGKLNDTLTDASLLFGDELHRIRLQMLEKTQAGERFELLKEWLLQRFDPQMLPPVEISSVLSKLKSQPFSRHSEAIAEYPRTQKHLIAQFRKYGGLSPKVFHKIFRFNGILASIREKHTINWSDIAFETGFADQSHFVRAFKEFSGINPTEFIRKGFNRQETNFFPLDRG